MYAMKEILVIIPVKAALWPTRFKKEPTRKTPKTGPLIKDAIERAWLNADSVWLRTARATPICTKPNTSVKTWETFKRCLSVTFARNGLYKSLTKVAAIELSDDDKAAAKMAATTKPEIPLGMCLVMKSGKTLSPPKNGKADPLAAS